MPNNTNNRKTGKQLREERLKEGRENIYNFGLLARLKEEKRKTRGIFVTYERERAELDIGPHVGGDVMALGNAEYIDAFVEEAKKNNPGRPFILMLAYNNPVLEEYEGDPEELRAMNRLAAALRECPGVFVYGPVQPVDLRVKNIFREGLKGGLVDIQGLEYEDIRTDAIEAMPEAKDKWRVELEEEAAGSKTGREKFKKALSDEATRKATATGFGRLDDTLDGGLFPGLYVFGAMSALGKTTFALQMADFIASPKLNKAGTETPGRDVMIFSLEMGAVELEAKSISRFSYVRAQKAAALAPDEAAKNTIWQYPKSTRGILRSYRKFRGGVEELEEAENKHIEESENDYFDGPGKHVYIAEGMGELGVKDIKTAVMSFKDVEGVPPVVIVDYLQILAPYDPKWTDKQNTDKAVLELKRLSRELNTPVIAISSFNRGAYNKGATMEAFKESGAIEYGCDVLIGLETVTRKTGTKRIKDKNGEDIEVNEYGDAIDHIALGADRKTERRGITLKILKNRNGTTNDIQYEFYPEFNYYEETGDKKTNEDKKAKGDNRKLEDIIREAQINGGTMSKR